MHKSFEINGKVSNLSPFSLVEFEYIGAYTGDPHTEFCRWLKFNNLHLLEVVQPRYGTLHFTDEFSLLMELRFDKHGDDNWRTLSELGYEVN